VPSALRRRLLGSDAAQRRVLLGVAAALFAGTFTAYAVGLFAVAGGVVFIPRDAARVAVLAAVWVGYRRGGLALAWLVAFAPFLGFRADWAFLGLSGRSLVEQAAYAVDPEGVAVNALFALVLGTLGFGAGWLLRWGVASAGADPGTDEESSD
jgi:hypothetical protein